MKRLLTILALTFIVAGFTATTAQATEVCTSTYETQTNPAYVPAVDQWFSWTGGQSATHPFPSGDWNPDNGNHNGQPFQGHINEAFQVSQGNSANWFYRQVTPAIGEPTIQVLTGATCETFTVDCYGNVTIYRDGILIDSHTDTTLIDPVACATDDPPADDPPADDPPADDPPTNDNPPTTVTEVGLAETGASVTLAWLALGLVTAGAALLYGRRVAGRA